MAFTKCIAAGYVLFCRTKENQKSASDFDALDPRIKGYSPLMIPKRFGSIQKIQTASLKDFLCSADLKSLRDGHRPTAVYAVSGYDPSREKEV